MPIPKLHQILSDIKNLLIADTGAIMMRRLNGVSKRRGRQEPDEVKMVDKRHENGRSCGM
jgi:hypothetical protein